MKKKANNKKEVKKIEAKKSSTPVKTETFITLQRELILKEEKRKKELENLTPKEIRKQKQEIKSLERDLKFHEAENEKTVKKIQQLEKQVNTDKRLTKKTIKQKLTQINQLKEIAKSKDISKTVRIDNKQYFKFNTQLTKDEINRIKGKDFNYYINDIFGNVMKVKNSDVKKDNFEEKTLQFIQKGLQEEEIRLKREIKKYTKLKDKKKVKSLKGSLYGIEKQLEKTYANEDALDIEDESEREEFLEEAIDETEAPIMINRRNNIIQILG